MRLPHLARLRHNRNFAAALATGATEYAKRLVFDWRCANHCNAAQILHNVCRIDVAIFFVWGILHARQALWPTEHIPGRNRQAIIELVGGDGLTSWQGKIIRLEGRRLYPAVGITLYGSELPEAGCVGQRWLMTIRARPVHGQLNEGGFDSQRYALAQHRPLSGRFLNASSLDSRCSFRARYLASLNRTLAEYPWKNGDAGAGNGGAPGSCG